jgi:hypothetical protein
MVMKSYADSVAAATTTKEHMERLLLQPKTGVVAASSENAQHASGVKVRIGVAPTRSFQRMQL